MVKWDPKRRGAASRRGRRAESAWKVPIHNPRGSAPSSAATRARISPAALLVKVTAKIRCGSTPRSRIRWATRAVRTRVFPEPAPASTSSGPPGYRTAASCWGFRARVVVIAPYLRGSSRDSALPPKRRCARLRAGAEARVPPGNSRRTHQWKLHHKLGPVSIRPRAIQQPPCVLLFHDAAGEGQPDPPSPGLGRDAWLEQLGPHVRRHARAVVAYGHAGGPCGRLDRDVDPPATPRERVDRVLDHRLERPLDEHGVAQRCGTGPCGRDRQGDGARERGHAGAEGAHGPLGPGPEPGRRTTAPSPPPLGTPCH